jgi:hypothetical protein
MPLDDVYNYFRTYDNRTYEVAACQGNEPSEADVAAFESVIGFRLPDEFREFTMSGLGGLHMEVRKRFWPRAKAYDIGPFWSFCYGLSVFGIASDIPEFLDIRVQYKQFSADGFRDLVPFLKIVSDSDAYCFDNKGHIVRWLHEEPERRDVLAGSFSDLLMREIRALEERKEEKLRGR